MFHETWSTALETNALPSQFNRLARGGRDNFAFQQIGGELGVGQQRWRRDNEALAIDIKGRDGAVTVGFTLTPKE